MFCEKESPFSSSIKTHRCLGKWKVGEEVIPILLLTAFSTGYPAKPQMGAVVFDCRVRVHNLIPVDPGLKLGGPWFRTFTLQAAKANLFFLNTRKLLNN